jgi:hypothetical protein
MTVKHGLFGKKRGMVKLNAIYSLYYSIRFRWFWVEIDFSIAQHPPEHPNCRVEMPKQSAHSKTMPTNSAQK